MTEQFDKILTELTSKKDRIRTIEIAKKNEQINALNLSYEAYYDGVYDALRAVENAQKGGNEHGEKETL